MSKSHQIVNSVAVATIAQVALTTSSVTQTQSTATSIANQTQVAFLINVANLSAGTVGYLVSEANNSSMTGKTTVPAKQVKRTLRNATGGKLADAATIGVNGTINLHVEPTGANNYITVDIVPDGFTGNTGAFYFVSGLLNP